MGFMKRKVYVEFTSKKTVNIVTSFRNAKFELNEEYYIDLLTMKKHKGCFDWPLMPSAFLIYFTPSTYEHNGKEYLDTFVGEIVALVRQDTPDVIQKVDFYNNRKTTTEVSVWHD